MVSSVSGGMMPPPPMQSLNSQSSLTDDQLQTIKDVLSEYDADKLTSSDALSIVETFQEVGIAPGPELVAAMSRAGFDAQTVGQLADVGNNQTGVSAPQQSLVTLNISDQMLQDLNALLDSYYSGQLSDEEKESALDSIKAIFEQTVPEGGLVNLVA